MNVPSKVGRRESRPWRLAASLPTLWLLASITASATAADFDERLKAPRVQDVARLRSEARSYSTRFAEQQAAAPEKLVANPALSRERFDLRWQITQAIDAHEPLGDLSAIGLEATGDGAYRMDFASAPQWNALEELLVGLLPKANWDGLGPQLIARGFRPEDVAALREYVATHDGLAAARQKSLPIAVAFSRYVKKLDKLKRPVTDDMVLSYLYQQRRAHADAVREWAQGLFGTVDAQRGRILVSYFSENPGGGLWTPSDRRAGIADVLATARLPNYEQLAKEEAQGMNP